MLGRQTASRRERRSSAPYSLRQLLKTLHEGSVCAHLNCGIPNEVRRASIEVQRRLVHLPVVAQPFLQEPDHTEIVAKYPYSACRRPAMNGDVVGGRAALTDRREEIELDGRRERSSSLRGLENAKDVMRKRLRRCLVHRVPRVVESVEERG